MIYPKSIQVHPGTFHADDVICCVQAKILNKSVKIIRSDKGDIDSDLAARKIVADTGGGMFDHHQRGAKIRSDGCKHCAASLLWEFWGKDVIRKVYPGISDEHLEIAWKRIDNGMMRTLSITDNGIILDKPLKFDSASNAISSVVGMFNPTWIENDNDENNSITSNMFMQALEITMKIFKRYIINEVDEAQATLEVMQLIEDKKHNGKVDEVLILDRYISWEEAVEAYDDILVVVYPSMRGGWNIQMAPVKQGSFNTKITVPQHWKGYRQGVKQNRPMEGMTFCHSSGFIAAFETKDAAVRAARYVVKEHIVPIESEVKQDKQDKQEEV